MILIGHDESYIPPPSVLSNYVPDDSDYITDPDKLRDALPQPFRMVNKLLIFAFDLAWDQISKREEERLADALLYKPPKFLCQSNVIDTDDARCMESSLDGEYIFVGLPNGIAVLAAETSQIIDQFTEEDIVITKISSACLNDGVQIISTTDALGIGRLFVFVSEKLYLAKVLNDKDGEQGPVIKDIIITSQCDFISITMENRSNAEVLLEFLKVPKDIWLKEANSLKDKSPRKQEQLPTPTEQSDAETIAEPGQTPADATTDANSVENKTQHNFRLASATTVLKVKAPMPIRPCNASSTYNAFKAIDSNADVVSTGNNHILFAAHLDSRAAVFRHHHKDLLPYAQEEDTTVSTPVVHFISSTRYSPASTDISKPTGALVRWTNGNQLMMYSLTKQAKDIFYKPDQVWPFSQTITASAVSNCGQMLAVGLSNGTVSIWDLVTGLQRRVVNVNLNIAVVHLDFVDPVVCQQYAEAETPYLSSTRCYVVALTDDGQLCRVGCSMGETSAPGIVSPRDLINRLENISFLPGIPQMILSSYTDGRIYLEDVLKGLKICEIIVPGPYQLSSDALSTIGGRGQFLYFRAQSSQTVVNDEEEEAIQTKFSLFCLCTLKFPSIETYWKRSVDATPFILHTTVDNRVDALIQERINDQPIRRARLQASWSQLSTTMEFIDSLKGAKRPPGTPESIYAASTLSGSETDLKVTFAF